MEPAVTELLNKIRKLLEPSNEFEALTEHEIRERAEHLAHNAGLDSAERAFALLDDGQLDGTQLEIELQMLRFLSDDQTRAQSSDKAAA